MDKAKGPLLTAGRYGLFVQGIERLLAEARRQAARSINAVLTATYWEIGRRIVEYEQGGKARAEYGEHLLSRLAKDLMAEHGRGFSARNLRLMRVFYSGWEIWQTPSAKSEARVKCPTLAEERPGRKQQTPPAKSKQSTVLLPAKNQTALADLFPLSWSHYVRLMMVEKPEGRAFWVRFVTLKNETILRGMEERLVPIGEMFLDETQSLAYERFWQ